MSIKMLSDLFSFTRKEIKKLPRLPSWIRYQCKAAIKDVMQVRENLKNMTKPNMRLGQYHFYRRNLGDAIFRFRMVEKFFDSGSKEACYYLGWCYLLKGKLQKSEEYLVKAGDEDEVHLLEFIRIIDTTQQVPPEIETVSRDILANNYIDQFADAEHYLPAELVNEININMITVPEQYEVLELGSNIGACGFEMRKRLPDAFNLTGIETSQIMFSMLKEEEDSKEEEAKNYSQLVNMPVAEFLAKNDNQYDLIVSLNGFSFTNELEEFFSTVKLSLAAKGIFAFVVRAGETTHLDKSLLEFNYNADEVTRSLKSNRFEIISQRELKLVKDANFYMFVVKPTW